MTLIIKNKYVSVSIYKAAAIGFLYFPQVGCMFCFQSYLEERVLLTPLYSVGCAHIKYELEKGHAFWYTTQ